MTRIGRWCAGRMARHVHLAAALTIIPSAIAAQARPADRTAGWRFTYDLASAAAGKPVGGASMQFDIAIWNGMARITVRQGPFAALTGNAGFLLLRSRDTTLVVVNPTRRDALVSAADDIAQLLSGPAGAAQFTVSDVRSVATPGVAGASAFGYATRSVQLEQAYTLAVALPTMQRVIRNEQEVRVDLSRTIDRLDPAFNAVAEHVLTAAAVPGSVRRALRAAQRRIPPGFPVRSVTTATTVSGTDTLRSVTRGTLGELRRVTVDTNQFVIPSGYRVTEMSRLLQSSPRRP